MTTQPVPARIGHYRVVRRIGQGGMGVVYEAEDERLHRLVALKVLSDMADDGEARRRLWQEARAAARVNHPNICQLHEVADADDTPFLVMELLEGESLADRVARGPLSWDDSRAIMADVLSALAALHAVGIVHGDLKPSNVFLDRHAVKLLDFGVATAAAPAVAPDLTATAETLAGSRAITGTPGYMSPEQLRGMPADVSSDLFAAGAVFFEMLSGTRAFGGATFVDVVHATAFAERPVPSLPRDDSAAIDNVVRRALAKEPRDRYPSATAMAEALGALRRQSAGREPHGALAGAQRRWLIVLPFRVLRSDAEAEFLAFGLADAITSSLGGLQTIGVRSSAVAARYAAEIPDLVRLAREATVDLVLNGTLMRAGQQIRVNIQLVEAPSGTLVWSHTAQATLHDVFQLQDDIVQGIVGSLPLPLTAPERLLLRHDVPASPAAYEFYLRASQISERVGLESVDQIKVARDLFRQSVELDPRFAPAWARLGRMHRVISKADDDGAVSLEQAESALQRALRLNPELAMAHNWYAQLETDLGRTGDALARLTRRAVANPADPEVFGGLVLVCRYCGLLEASAAAHDRARRLDPQISTSVRHTYWLLGDSARALAGDTRFFFEAMVLATDGRRDEALAILHNCQRITRPEPMRIFLRSLHALVEGRREEALEATEFAVTHFRDPEAMFYMVRQLAYLGADARCLHELARVLDRGYLCSRALRDDPWLASVRGAPEFARLLERAEAGERDMAAVLEQSGVRELLFTPTA